MTLRVLHVIYDDPGNPWVGGGGAVRVRELYRRLADRVDATVLTGCYPGAPRDEVVEGVRYLRLGARRPYAWSRLSFAAAATARLRRDRYDAAVLDFSGYTPVRVPRDRPVGITVHHLSGPDAARRWGRVAAGVIAGSERALLRRGRCFSATSGATNRQLRRIVGGSARIESVPAGVPDDLFELERAEDDYLLYFGRIDVYHKGIDTVLEAFATIASRFPDVELRIAGRGRDGERVRGLARRLGVEGRIRFLGAVSDGERRRLFGGALAQLMPSRFEGFGMAAAEAMAAGVPVIASSAGSLPEVVDPPRGGIVVPRGDAGALAEGVARLLADPHLRNATSASARRSAERFRWASVARRHLEFLRRVADQSRQTHPQSR